MCQKSIENCWWIKDVPVYPPENQIQFAMAYYVINYSELRIWNFEEYEKMVYFDADIQVFENIDHLIDYPDGYFYAVMDCFCENTWSHSPQYSVGYCQQCPERVPWPSNEKGFPPQLHFNAGMFVFEPSRITCTSLLESLMVTSPTPFAEQGSKPWRYTGNDGNMEREDIKMLVAKWRDIYNDRSLEFKTDKIDAAQDDGSNFKKHGLVGSTLLDSNFAYVTAPSAA